LHIFLGFEFFYWLSGGNNRTVVGQIAKLRKKLFVSFYEKPATLQPFNPAQLPNSANDPNNPASIGIT
jgi:hypothetical protein